MAKTVKVRIPVAVDPSGRYYAHGWGDESHNGPDNHIELLETVDVEQIGPNEALFWITAEFPVPEASEVAAEVSSV